MGKKSQNIPFRSSVSYFYDLEACYGFNPIAVNAGDICEGCRRAVQEYRSTGKTFHHVSVACHFLFSRKHFTTVRLTWAKREMKLVKKCLVSTSCITLKECLCFMFLLFFVQKNNDLIEANWAFLFTKSFSLRELSCEAARVVWHILLIRLQPYVYFFCLKVCWHESDSMWPCSKKEIFCIRRVS